MNTKELRELSVDELNGRSRELRKEILHSRVQQAAGQLENSARLNDMRKDIARIHTLLSERRLGIVRSAAPKAAKTTKKTAAKKAARKPKAASAE